MIRPRTAALAVPLLGVLALSACAAGIDAQTSRVRTTTNSVGGAIGTITVRNVYVVGPATQGGSATVVAALFNGGADPDTLTGISSGSAGAGAVPTNVVLAPGASNIYDALGGDQLRLTGLKANLPVGGATTVTFSFARAGTLTLGVPVEPLGDGEGNVVTPSATPSSPATLSPLPSSTGTGVPAGTVTGQPTVGASGAPSPTPTG